VLAAVAAEAAAAGLRADTVLVDAHCHLQLDPLHTRAASGEARAAAARAHVALAVVCGTCPGSDWDRVQALYEADPSFIRPQFGLHPWWIQRHLAAAAATATATATATAVAGEGEGLGSSGAEGDAAVGPAPGLAGLAGPAGAGLGWVAELEARVAACPAAGVGECGLDKAIARAVPLDTQEDILGHHVAVAGRYRRPVTIHCVGSWGRLLDALRRLRPAHPGVSAYVLHSCNSMPPEMAANFAALDNVYFSFTGTSTHTTPHRRLLPPSA